MLVVQGDLATMAQYIQAHELLYRSGLAAHLVVTTTTDILAPDVAARLVPWIQLPALIGEGSLCLWLL